MESRKDFKKRMHRQKEKVDKHNAKARLNKLSNGWKEEKDANTITT